MQTLTAGQRVALEYLVRRAHENGVTDSPPGGDAEPEHCWVYPERVEFFEAIATAVDTELQDDPDLLDSAFDVQDLVSVTLTRYMKAAAAA